MDAYEVLWETPQVDRRPTVSAVGAHKPDAVCLCICLLSLVMHAKMLQSSLILYARNERTFYDRIILVGTYIFVDIPLVSSFDTNR